MQHRVLDRPLVVGGVEPAPGLLLRQLDGSSTAARAAEADVEPAVHWETRRAAMYILD